MGQDKKSIDSFCFLLFEPVTKIVPQAALLVLRSICQGLQARLLVVHLLNRLNYVMFYMENLEDENESKTFEN